MDSSPLFDNTFLTSNGWVSADNGITFTKNVTYGSVKLDTTASTLTYYLDQQSNLTGRLRQGQTVTETIPVQVTDGQLTALTNAVFTIDGQNDEPELYLVNNLVGAFEDVEYEITYANLTNKSQRADIDGSVTAFVVKNVTSGVLKIGANSQSATPWNATNNATISSGLNGYWNPALNANGTLGAFTVVVKDDGGLNSLNPLQVNVQVASVNDRPFVTAGATVSYTENAAATVIDAGITITDVDDTQISGATVKIGQIVTGDVLGFTNQTGITGIFDSQTGILSLSGTATVAQYQQALRTVTFSSTSEDPTVNNTQNNRTITWAVTDVNSSNAANGVLTSDNSSGVSTSYLTGSAQTLNANGSNPYIIAVDLGQNWSFEADYKMNSSNGLNTLFSYGNLSGGVLIRTLRGDSLYVNGVSLGTIDVFGTSNTNGVFVPIKITYSTTGSTGTLSIYASGSLITSVTTNSPLNPVDKTIRLGSAHHSNGEGFDGAVKNIKVTIGAGSATTSTINILAVNSKPVVTAGATVSYTENAAATVIDAGITITDVDDTTLTSAIVTITNAVNGDVLGFTNQSGITGSYTNGVLTLSGTATIAQYQAALRSVTYLSTSEDPTVGDTRNNRTITWSVTDSNSDAVGAQNSLGVTSTINIAAVNDAPVAIAQTIAPIEDTTYSGTLTGSDVENSALTYSVVSQGAKGFVTITNTVTGAFTYVPNANANGFDSFTFKVNDGSLNSATATVTVNITAVNDTPIVVNIPSVVYTNTNAVDVFPNATGTILASDADANAVLTYGILGQGVISNGSAALAGQFGTLRIVTATGEYFYAPNQSQLDHLSGDAVDNFTFTISDGTVTINKPFVVNINDREAPAVPTIALNTDTGDQRPG